MCFLLEIIAHNSLKNINCQGSIQTWSGHLKTKFKSEFSPHIIEDLKRNLCDIATDSPPRSQTILGKNIQTGQPSEVEISVHDLSAALQQPLTILMNGIYAEFSRLSPRVVTDLMENGILLCGGGAQLTSLASFLQENLQIPFHTLKIS